jgi:hypothetical protein
MLQVHPDVLIAEHRRDLATDAAHQRLLRQVPREPSVLGRYLADALDNVSNWRRDLVWRRRSVSRHVPQPRRASQLDNPRQSPSLRTDSDLIPG